MICVDHRAPEAAFLSGLGTRALNPKPYLEGQEDLASGFKRRIFRVTIWVIGVMNLLSPLTPQVEHRGSRGAFQLGPRLLVGGGSCSSMYLIEAPVLIRWQLAESRVQGLQRHTRKRVFQQSLRICKSTRCPADCHEAYDMALPFWAA